MKGSTSKLCSIFKGAQLQGPLSSYKYAFPLLSPKECPYIHFNTLFLEEQKTKQTSLSQGRGTAQYCQDCFCTGCTPQPWPALLSVLVPARGPCTPRSHSGTACNRRTHSQIFALDVLKNKKLTSTN